MAPPPAHEKAWWMTQPIDGASDTAADGEAGAGQYDGLWLLVQLEGETAAGVVGGAFDSTAAKQPVAIQR